MERGKRKARDKAGAQPPAKRLAPAVREGVGFTQLEIADSEVLLFSGSAWVEVVEGVLDADGYVLSAGAPPLLLRTGDSASGGPVRLQALAAQAQVPLAARTAAKAVVTPLQGAGMQPGGAPAAGGTDPSRCDCAGYALAAEGAPAAPGSLQPPPGWAEAVRGLAAERPPGGPPVVAVCGSKGAGKSTLARRLVNALLPRYGRVAYLDTDCGQPEMTPPGLVSLHVLEAPLFGPPHTHMRAPEAAFFQGDTSPQTDPGRYLQSVLALHARYLALRGGGPAADGACAGPPMPLVVNTHGWISGVGLDLVAEMLRCIQPTDVVTLQADNAKRNLPAGCFWADAGSGPPPATALLQLAALPRAPGGLGAAAAAEGGGSLLSRQSSHGEGATAAAEAQAGAAGSAKGPGAVEARGLQWLAWARAVSAGAAAGGGAAGRPGGAPAAAGSDAEALAAAAEALAACPPYEVAMGDVGVQLLHCAAPAEQLAAAVNGAVVGLAAAAPDPASGGALRPCVGLGLVRGIDAAAGKLYLLTDVPPSRLEGVQCLQLGRLELPAGLLQAPRLAPPYQALFCLAGAATGAGAIKSRNNLLRAGLAMG